MSWKTTLFAIIAAIGGAIMGAYQLKPDLLVGFPHWLPGAGLLMSVIGGACVGVFARDNNKTSEQVGADPASKAAREFSNPPAGLGLLFVLACSLIGFVVGFSGCASFSTTTFRIEDAAASAGTNAVSAYNSYFRALPADQQTRQASERDQVYAASRKFAASLGVLEQWRAAYETNAAVKPQVQAGLEAALAQSSNVVWLVQYFRTPANGADWDPKHAPSAAPCFSPLPASLPNH